MRVPCVHSCCTSQKVHSWSSESHCSACLRVCTHPGRHTRACQHQQLLLGRGVWARAAVLTASNAAAADGMQQHCSGTPHLDQVRAVQSLGEHRLVQRLPRLSAVLPTLHNLHRHGPALPQAAVHCRAVSHTLGRMDGGGQAARVGRQVMRRRQLQQQQAGMQERQGGASRAKAPLPISGPMHSPCSSQGMV